MIRKKSLLYCTNYRLHILAEIEDAKTLLKLQNGEKLSAEDLTKVMNIWQVITVLLKALSPANEYLLFF